jgi:hypothetical protein
MEETEPDMTTTADPLETMKEYGKERGYDLGWLEKRESWGTHLTPDKSGLTLEVSEQGIHGETPDQSTNMTTRTRGSVPRPATPRIGNYAIRTKADIWLRNAAGLWEEANQRQWSSATDIPWHTIAPLPDDIERAQCQFATFLTEVEFVAGDVPGKWIAATSPDYFEPKMFLVSQIVDEARHLDVFRKRALVNGGGLMMRTASASSVAGGGIDSARDFTEMSSRLHISGEGAVLTLFRIGELMAYNEAEKHIYRLCAQDESRHVAFGVLHLQYIGHAQPERREEIHSYLDEAELLFASGGGGQNPASPGLLTSSEALAIMLGGGVQKYDEGMKLLAAARQRQVKEYVQRVRVAGFGERFENGRSPKALLDYAQAA